MMAFYVVAWAALILFALFVFILLIAVKYDFRGCWQEKFSGDVKIGAGPFGILFKWSAEGKNIFIFRLAGIPLWKGPLEKNEKKADRKKKEPSPAKKAESANWRDAFDFLEQDFLKAVLQAAGDILRHSAPRVLELKGVWGFDDPYCTGILAAVTTVVPGIRVEPDFTGEVRDLEALVQGRIRPVVLLYYGLRLLISRQARPVLKKLWRKRKNKKEK